MKKKKPEEKKGSDENKPKEGINQKEKKIHQTTHFLFKRRLVGD